jgi:hypothetical protein
VMINPKTALTSSRTVNHKTENPVTSASPSINSSPSQGIVGNARSPIHQKLKKTVLDSLTEAVVASTTERQKLQHSSNEKMFSYCHRQPYNPAKSNIFVARPVPETCRIGGTGGLQGIQKVEKRKPTVPRSPMLGPKRLKQNNPNETTNKVSVKKTKLRTKKPRWYLWGSKSR